MTPHTLDQLAYAWDQATKRLLAVEEQLRAVTAERDDLRQMIANDPRRTVTAAPAPGAGCDGSPIYAGQGTG